MTDLLRLQPADAAAEQTLDVPPASNRIPALWAVGGVVAWIAFFTFASLIEPPAPADMTPPFVVGYALELSSITLLATFVGFGMRRRWAFAGSAVTALFLLGTVSWCATHLGVGAVLIAQLAGVGALLLGSVAGLLRR